MKKFLLTAVLVGAGVAAAQTTITGAGASFPAPLYSKIFDEYRKAQNVQVNYQSVGSGTGIRQILAQTVDFGASDAFLTAEQLNSAPGKNRVLHIPTALAAIVPAYNVPGVAAATKLRFDGELLADIFLGNIRSWNDARITRLNPNVNLPNLPITVVRRADGSGSTAIFVDYLSSVSSEFAQKIGKGPQTSVNWPVGVGGQGNAGVAGLIRQTPGGIGYTEITYAKQNSIAYGLVKSSGGSAYIDGGDLRQVAAAANGKPLPADTRVSIVNSSSGYPISGFTWLLVYRNQQYGGRTEAQARALVGLLQWVISESGGQQYHEALNYGTLSDLARSRAQALVNQITYGNTALR